LTNLDDLDTNTVLCPWYRTEHIWFKLKDYVTD